MKQKVCILDYGSGNVKSVFNILNLLTSDVKISNDVNDIDQATHLILPGVGAFGASMSKIKEKIPLPQLERAVMKDKKPFLGICVGMQVLADKGLEFGEHQGLGWIAGAVKKIETIDLPLPHVGWNNIEIKHPSPLVAGFNNTYDFYYVHSYYFEVKDPMAVVAKTEYGHPFCSILQKDNIYGVQFHPEKSQQAGKLLLENFLKL